MSLILPSVETEKCLPKSVSSSRHHSGILVSTEQSNNELLPELRSSASVDLSKPLPTSLQSDFLPQEIIFTLTQPQLTKQNLRPPTRGRSIRTPSLKNTCHAPPANVWNYKRRNHFKHLLEDPPCICGAGKDISFLYDIQNVIPHPPKPETLDKSHVRKEEDTSIIKPLVLPDSIVPEDYHIVKHKGVLGIQYHEDKYSTQAIDHEKHLSVFPSMNPTSRYEVIQLRNTFESLMNKAGINDLEADAGGGPTQMHKLLELIKKEQDIFNIVFNELIRQTTVECVERGELLHLVWNKYHQLLNKVPELIMSLHEDVIAQRALDIRLTDELMRFKNTIGTLTNELADVKEHDKKVTWEAQKAQEDLKSALMESQKNASLIIEYHDLYELQRHRLEGQVFVLSEERDIWCTAAYSLAVKVIEEYKLNTAIRLQLLEKSWTKIASHFTILLSDRDTDLLTKIQDHVEKWRDLIENMNMSLKQREDNMRSSLKIMQDSVENCLTIFKQEFMDIDNELSLLPDESFTKLLLTDVKLWHEHVVKADTFNGVMLLNSREAFAQIRKEMEEWTDCGLKMFGRHCSIDNKPHPYQTSMLALNTEINQFLMQLHDRITGENGIANLINSLQNSLETWEARLKASLAGTLIFQESDWVSFYGVLEQWLLQLNQAFTLTDVPDPDNDQLEAGSSIQEVIRKTQMWTTRASNSIDSEDAKLVEKVSCLHSEMVRWMIQVLLRFAPNMEGYTLEGGNMALLGSASIQQLTETAGKLFESLEMFSNYVTICCDGIVTEETLVRQDSQEGNATYEMNDLKRLRSECNDWIRTAQILMSQLTGTSMELKLSGKSSAETLEDQDDINEDSAVLIDMETGNQISEHDVIDTEAPKFNDSKELKTEELQTEELIPEISVQESVDKSAALTDLTTETLLTNEESSVGPLKPSEGQLDDISIAPKSRTEQGQGIEVLGVDSNTHKKCIEEKHIKAQQTFQFVIDESLDTRKAFEALAAVETLQTQLIATEGRAQQGEERASQAEAEIESLNERIRALEKQLEKYQLSINVQPSSTSTIAHSRLQPTVTSTKKVQRACSPQADTEAKEEKSGKKSGKAKTSKKN